MTGQKIIFICSVCKKPKSMKQLSEKADYCGRAQCKKCARTGGSCGVFFSGML